MRVWFVDLLVAVRVLPLQCLSLVVVTLPWTLPRLLALQLANPASVIEGALETARSWTSSQHSRSYLLLHKINVLIRAIS